jgi:hypothetical protein
MLPTKFRFIWPSGFRGEDFFKSANQKQELPVVAMFVNGSGQTKFQFIWESGFRGEDFLEINQSETRMVCGGHVY